MGLAPGLPACFREAITLLAATAIDLRQATTRIQLPAYVVLDAR